MAVVLLGGAGVLVAFTLAAVYSAFVLAHKTDEMIAALCEDVGTAKAHPTCCL